MPIEFKLVTVVEGQSLNDVALQEYGANIALMMLYADNNDVLPYLNYRPVPGTELKIRKVTPVITSDNKQLLNYYLTAGKQKHVVNNGLIGNTALPSYLDGYLSEVSVPLGDYIEEGYWDSDYVN